MHTKLIKAPMRRSRRRYTEEFKKQAIEACSQPGVSMASVALANGLNANLLRRWVTERQEEFAALQTELAASERQRREYVGEIKQRDLKIQKLTLELAYYKRIKFGTKSESVG